MKLYTSFLFAKLAHLVCLGVAVAILYHLTFKAPEFSRIIMLGMIIMQDIRILLDEHEHELATKSRRTDSGPKP